MLPGLAKARLDRLSASQLVFRQQTCFSRSCASSLDGTLFICRTSAFCPPSRVSWELSVPVPPDFGSFRMIRPQAASAGDCRAGSRRDPTTTKDCDFAPVFQAWSNLRLAPPVAWLHAANVDRTDRAVLLIFPLRRLKTVKRTDQHPREENFQSFRGSPTGGHFFS